MKHPFRRWKHIRATNIIDRGFKKVKRRVRVIRHSLLRNHVLEYYLVYLNYKMRFGRVSPLQVFSFTHESGRCQVGKFELKLLSNPNFALSDQISVSGYNLLNLGLLEIA